MLHSALYKQSALASQLGTSISFGATAAIPAMTAGRFSTLGKWHTVMLIALLSTRQAYSMEEPNTEHLLTVEEALQARHDELVELLDRGLDPDIPIEEKTVFQEVPTERMAMPEYTPVSVTTLLGHFAMIHHKKASKIIKLLLAHGSRVNGNIEDVFTPLMQAAILGNTPLVRILLRYGANPRIRSKTPEGLTAKQLAHKFQHDKVAALIERNVQSRDIAHDQISALLLGMHQRLGDCSPAVMLCTTTAHHIALLLIAAYFQDESSEEDLREILTVIRLPSQRALHQVGYANTATTEDKPSAVATLQRSQRGYTDLISKKSVLPYTAWLAALGVAYALKKPLKRLLTSAQQKCTSPARITETVLP